MQINSFRSETFQEKAERIRLRQLKKQIDKHKTTCAKNRKKRKLKNKKR